uniref:Uncharacterized protein n=1 Tax=Arundo donax TaxID=35708 RepID=A0A0A9C027_ARUDO
MYVLVGNTLHNLLSLNYHLRHIQIFEFLFLSLDL